MTLVRRVMLLLKYADGPVHAVDVLGATREAAARTLVYLCDRGEAVRVERGGYVKGKPHE